MSQAIPVKKRSDISPVFKRLSSLLMIAGVLVCLVGIYGYLQGDLKAGFLSQSADRLKAAYQASLSTGESMSFLDGALYAVMKFAMVFIIAGSFLILNSVMMRIQNRERYKFPVSATALVLLVIFVYYPVLICCASVSPAGTCSRKTTILLA